MKSDLVIGFGFSKINADIALDYYEKGKKLTEEELFIFDHLLDKDPFTKSRSRHGINITMKMAEILEHLNFKITKEN